MSELKLPLLTAAGTASGDKAVSEVLFGREAHGPLMHQAVVRQLANGRAGTHFSKTRSEVSGGGRKPWKQKGTGRARQGSIRASQWRGGGVAFGPKPRDYSQSMNKQDRRAALASAVSTRMDVSSIFDPTGLEAKAKAFATALKAMGADSQKVLLVAGKDETNVRLASRNNAQVRLAEPENLSVLVLLWADRILYTPAALAHLEGRFGNG